MRPFLCHQTECRYCHFRSVAIADKKGVVTNKRWDNMEKNRARGEKCRKTNWMIYV